MLRLLLALVVVLCGSARAHAQLGFGPVTSGPTSESPTYPFTTYFLPLESAYVRSHVDLQFLYTNASVGTFLGRSADVNVILLGLEGRFALADAFEVGLNFPFLTHANSTWGQITSSGTELGNLTLKLKGKFFGTPDRRFALALFLNTTLPTGTNQPTREWALMQGGLAFGAFFAPMWTAGVDLGVAWFISGPGKDQGLFLADLFVGLRPHPLFGFQLGLQIATPVYTAEGDPGFAIAPVVQFFPLPFLHFDLGARIAVNDNGKLYTPLGRASLVFSGGGTF
jgi:hypothetical protein